MLGIGAFFAALFGGSGATVPFIPVWFRAQGLGAAEIGIILAAPYFGRAFIGPLLALWADRFRLRRTPIALMAAGSSLAFLAMMVWHGFWPWLITFFIGSTLLGVTGPLGDVIALREARLKGFAYGLPRGLGSAAYMIANLIMGVLLTRAGAVSVVIWTVATAGLTAAAALWLLPATPVDTAPAAERHTAKASGGLGRLLRDPMFILAITAVSLIQSTHGFYYSFSTLLWRNQGLAVWTGPLWAFAVTCEVLFMWCLEPWRQRLGPERLLIAGGLAAAARWLAMGFAPPLWLLFPLQSLHALSFAATYLAALRLVERLCPPQDASAGQTLNAALSSGVMIGAVTALSGPLFDTLGARAYWAMAMVAGIGTILAVLLAGKLKSPSGR